MSCAHSFGETCRKCRPAMPTDPAALVTRLRLCVDDDYSHEEEQ